MKDYIRTIIESARDLEQWASDNALATKHDLVYDYIKIVRELNTKK